MAQWRQLLLVSVERAARPFSLICPAISDVIRTESRPTSFISPPPTPPALDPCFETAPERGALTERAAILDRFMKDRTDSGAKDKPMFE
jgi:hypothetical protein